MDPVFKIVLIIFLISVLSFVFVIFHERRTLWSGMTLTASLFSSGLLALLVVIRVADSYRYKHSWVVPLVTLFALAVLLLIFIFFMLIIGMLLYDGVKIIIKEGNSLTNYLSLGLGVFLICFIFLYPNFGRLYINDWFTYLYLFISLEILYFLYIMVMYILTSWINLINQRNSHLNYVVVLGAGLLHGEQVSPLLAARIKRGIEIMKNNPDSKLILSGGKGKDENIPEAVAMANYAKNLGIKQDQMILETKSKTTNENIKFSHELMLPNSRFCLVTNSYHVYRALVLAKRQGLKCIGYGAKTKWYFTLNAFIREFIAYITITKKLQIFITCGLFLLCLVGAIIDNLH